jgi:pimeloyl-ACP methyl ester carboxylesterase
MRLAHRRRALCCVSDEAVASPENACLEVKVMMHRLNRPACPHGDAQRLFSDEGRNNMLSGMQPKTGYAQLGEDRIAYQIVGDGAVDLVLTPGTWGSMNVEWEKPEWAHFYRRMAEFCRVIRYDTRGSGSSDPVPLDALQPWESSADEVLAVMDAVGSERATILGFLNGGAPAMLFAATRPERTAGLILNHTAARYARSDDYPWRCTSPPVSRRKRTAAKCSCPGQFETWLWAPTSRFRTAAFTT